MATLEIAFSCFDLQTIIIAMTIAKTPITVHVCTNIVVKIYGNASLFTKAVAFSIKVTDKIGVITAPAILPPCRPKNQSRRTITEYNTTANKESLATNNGANSELITAGNKAPPLSAPTINRTATTAAITTIFTISAFNGSATKGGTASGRLILKPCFISQQLNSTTK